MATNLFSRAAAYRKKHPGMTMPEAVKHCSKTSAGSGKRKAAKKKVSGVKRSKADTSAIRKLRAAGYSVESSKYSSNVYAKKNGTTYADTPQDLVRRLLSVHSVGKVRRKKTAAKKAAPRKIKVKIKPKGSQSITIGKAKKRKSSTVKKVLKDLGISGLSHQKMGHELQHVRSLETMRDRHKLLLKEKGLSVAQKAHIRREIAKYNDNIRAAKKHISALKRSI